MDEKAPKVLYEDKHLLCLNKPSGLKVHADGVVHERTLVDWIIENYPEIRKVGEPLTLSSRDVIERPGIVHRLDKETSGVIIVAKDEDTFSFLKMNFQSRTIEKTYEAVVYGVPNEIKGVIDKPITRSKKDFRKRTIAKANDVSGRNAITKFEIIKKFRRYSFLALSPETGRTHQIRVHLHSIGHPVVCDYLYAKGKECPRVIGRTALHAKAIEFTLPDGTRIGVEAERPPDFTALIAHIGEL